MRRTTFAALGPAATPAPASPTGTAAQAAAPAAQGDDRCPSGHLRVFDGHDGTGPVAWFRYGTPDLRQRGPDRRVGSHRNRMPSSARALYDRFGRIGHRAGPLAERGNPSASGNDRARSVDRYACR
ncbi:peptidase inhibitor family I36 protein [Streptomyces sp. TRM70308]|uniref:peptidase inhibitor family I36 protein n=1 Tax=Streptomyces sp. TRM70308 TaxID=3131932 RepID=UPI003D08A75E